ncbi:hypothetical protein ABKN59_011997, partial [Abortiporus biennis]
MGSNDTCSFCGDKTSGLKQSNRRAHAELKKHGVFECAYCDKVFLHPGAWHDHTSSPKHFGKPQQIPLRFPCESCSTKTFDSLMLLNEHKKKEHSALQPPPTVASITPAQPSLPSTPATPDFSSETASINLIVNKSKTHVPAKDLSEVRFKHTII